MRKPGLAAFLGGATAFVHVNVVPMDRERVLADQTVVVRDAEIVAIGPSATTKPPEGATIVEGGGAYLLPGLADLHVHAKAPDDLALYVVNGVTTVLNLGEAGSSFVTGTRRRIAAGELLGPTCLVAPLLDGTRGGDLPSSTPDEARASVRRAKEIGYDFIKVYNDLSRDSFRAVCDEAATQGLAVVGHAVRAPGLEESFEAGQVMLAHAEEYLYTVMRGERGGPPDASRLPYAVELTRKHGAYVCPNLSAYERIAAQWGRATYVKDVFLAEPESRWLRPWWRERWQRGQYVGTNKPGGLDDRVPLLRKLTKALHDAGVPLLLGTDSPDIPGLHAGFSIHDDLRNLVESGLSPFDAISCGTRVAGAFVEQFVPDAAPFGTVEVGKRADLMLVEANPLEDPARLKSPRGVMLRGRWLPRAELDSLLEGLVRAAAACDAWMARIAAAEKEGKLAAAIAAYLGAKEGRAAADAPAWAALDEEVVNARGYRALRTDLRRDDAIAWFELNTQLWPKSGNAWDSLGEALMVVGRNDASVKSFRRSLELDPGNDHARDCIANMTGEAEVRK
jgi:imidazolonepropionase-like amidohydrolase